MIRFACPSCGVKLEVPETAAGTRGTCPECGHAMRPPVPPEGDGNNGNAFGILSLILAVVSILALFPLLGFVSLPCALLGLLFGHLGKRDGNPTLAKVGGSLSGFVLFVLLVGGAVLLALFMGRTR